MAYESLEAKAQPVAKLTASQERAIAALLNECSVKAAAGAAGINRGTLHRWMTDDAVFIAAYNRDRQDRTEAMRHELRLMADEAMKVVRTVMTGAETAMPLRLRAALAIIKANTEAPAGLTEVEDVQLALNERDYLRKQKGYRFR
jgi:hypothetical protein